MITDNLGVCQGVGNSICSIKIGNNNIKISNIGKNYYILLNNRSISASKSKKEFVSKNALILSLILKNLCKEAKKNSLKIIPNKNNKEHADFLGDTLKTISENLKPVSIFVLQSKPDEIVDNKPSIEANIKGELEGYKNNVIKFGENIEVLNHESEILLKTNLDKNMWGSKEVMLVLGNIKKDLYPFLNSKEIIERNIESSCKNISFIQDCGRYKKAYISKDVLGKIIDNFSYLKTYMSKLAQVCQDLYNIDKTFKVRLGYPATWFMSGSVYTDYILDYDALIDNLIKCAHYETNLIEPLLAKKINLKY